MTDAPLTLSLSIREKLSLATEHAELPAVLSLTIHNSGSRTLERVELAIGVEPDCGTEWRETLAAIGPGQTKRFDAPRMVMSPDVLRSWTETQKGLVRATARWDDAVATVEAPISLLPATHWPGSDAPLELLASFVRWSPSLQGVLRKAADQQEQARGVRTFDGYQSGRRQRVVDQVQAIWVALSAEGIDYLSPPPSFETHGQKIVPPGEVLECGSGACLDLSVLMAALLERVGLHPVLVIVQGHAFVGVWLDGTPYSSAIHDACIPVRKAVDGGELLLLETTLLAGDATLPVAQEAARKHLDDADAFLFLLDIHTARETFKPLPFDGARTTPQAEERVLPAGEWTEATVVEKEQLDRSAEPRSGLEARLTSWKEKLLDLTLRNRLLNLREGKSLVRLHCPDPAALEDWLAAGARVPILPRPERRGEVDQAVIDRRAVGLHERRQTLADHTERDLLQRLKELSRSGKTSIEESGAVTTYLVVGMLRWYDDKSPEKERYAPILLIPVTIFPARGDRPSEVEISDMADTQLNVTLLTWLRKDHGLEHAGLGMDALPEDDAGVDVPRILQRFRELVRAKSDWEVEDRAVLAPLTFKKFLMYKDLEASTGALLQNDVVRRILTGDGGGYGLERPLLAEDELDAALPPAEVLPVLPADPSQLTAVAACAHGSSFVLQGPPGTGKSQTITNLIADTLARGQTVLFVAEKKAAIEVVHRRLEQVGLGPFTLELHSDKASKKQSIQQLRSAIAQVHAREPENWEAVAAELSDLRAELNRFADAMRSPTVVGLPVYAVLGELIGLRDTAAVAVDFGDLTSGAARRQDALVDQAVGILAQIGSPAASPWKWARLQQASAQLPAQLADRLDGLESATARAGSAGASLSPVWSLAGDATERAAVVTLARCLSVAGTLPPGLLSTPDLDEAESLLAELEAQSEARVALWKPLDPAWEPALLAEGVQRGELLARFEKWAGVFLFGWLLLWGARKQLVRFARSQLPASVQVRDDLRRMEETARADVALAARDGEARALLGSLWKRDQTDWAKVRSLWLSTRQLREACLHVPGATAEEARRMWQEQRDRLVPGTPLSDALQQVVDAGTALEGAWSAVGGVIERAAEAPPLGTLSSIRAWTEAARTSGATGLRNWTAWQRARASLLQEGLGALVDALESGTVPPRDLPSVLRRARAQYAWEQACGRHPHLPSFQGLTHDRLIERFRTVDRDWERLTAELVRARIAARMPDPNAPGEMAIIRRQLHLKTRHTPLRRLFREVPTAMRALKPVVLMSPLAVARYLDPASNPYDLVLFDEASQIPPWDAIGAIARGRRSVVVGDTKQLPPTAFFSRSDSDDEAEDEDTLQDMESILEEAISSGLHELRLLWHYRSQHESLITFSNRSYYGNGLLTFPSALHTADHLGVCLVPVPEGHYDRGGSRTNRAEADAVVAWIAQWARRPVDQRGSVGVVTFNMNQQRLIEDLLDSAAASDPELEAAREAGDEPLFVKNLENVQGDERDTILFSICYAPDRAGRLTQNYGPLNKKGGERRLNVAVTRARRHLRVFSTLRHDQIPLSQARAVGVQHLRAFLDFARRGVQALDEATYLAVRARTESPFEDEVLAVLQEEGWSVVPQVGCSGYRIDLGVEDPERPGTFLLAVECDGAAYHSSSSARARDRQRQEVLERLGWRFHRIWSTDWWHDRAGERERLRQALVEAQEAAARAPELPVVPTAVPDAIPSEPVEAELRQDASAPPEAPARAEFALPPLPATRRREALYQPDMGGRWLAELVEAVAPLHEDTAFRWLLESVGASGRLTTRTRSQLDGLVARGAAQHRLERHDGFLWRPGQRLAWQDWRRIGSRSAEELALEEVRNAAREMLQGALAVSEDELVRALAKELGFGRVGRRVAERMSRGIAMLLAEGWAHRSGDKLIWSHREG